MYFICKIHTLKYSKKKVRILGLRILRVLYAKYSTTMLDTSNALLHEAVPSRP